MQKFSFLFIILVYALILNSCTPAASTLIPTSTARPVASSTPVVMACRLLHFPATPEALAADFGGRGHIAGPAVAPVTIVVFSDYQCPACAFLAANLKLIRLSHPEDVRIIYINSPITGHDKDIYASQAVEAADLQGKFWEMHDLLFEKQTEWASLSLKAFTNWLDSQAAGLGIDLPTFQVDFTGETVAKRVQVAVQASANQTISPPILFVNSNTPYTGLADFADLDTVVRMEALSARQFTSCPPWIIDPIKQYVVTLHTAKGDVVLQLLPDKAPIAVNNFVSLVRSGWYNNITFYKMIPDFIVMTGDPSETGMGNPGYLIGTEIYAGLLFDQPGLVAMDNSGPDTNGSRFFITLAPADQLYGQYTVIGKVITGLDVLNKLTPRDPKPGVYLPPGDGLINVTVQEH
jgi:cyclophilin family peptidyl-prolyl cis-trans isomerase/protein-disulfide isomerase